MGHCSEPYWRVQEDSPQGERAQPEVLVRDAEVEFYMGLEFFPLIGLYF